MARRRKHPELTEDTLRALAASAHQAYLIAAATHPKTPDDALYDVFRGEDAISYTIRYPELVVEGGYWQASIALARRRRLPEDLLLSLAYHDDPEVAEVALVHRAVPAWALHHLAGKDEWRRRAIAANPKCPGDLLDELSHDRERKVLVAVASNRNTPVDALERLSGSEHQSVRRAVSQNESATDDIRSVAALSL